MTTDVSPSIFFMESNVRDSDVHGSRYTIQTEPSIFPSFQEQQNPPYRPNSEFLNGNYTEMHNIVPQINSNSSSHQSREFRQASEFFTGVSEIVSDQLQFADSCYGQSNSIHVIPLPSNSNPYISLGNSIGRSSTESNILSEFVATTRSRSQMQANRILSPIDLSSTSPTTVDIIPCIACRNEAFISNQLRQPNVSSGTHRVPGTYRYTSSSKDIPLIDLTSEHLDTDHDSFSSYSNTTEQEGAEVITVTADKKSELSDLDEDDHNSPSCDPSAIKMNVDAAFQMVKEVRSKTPGTNMDSSTIESGSKGPTKCFADAFSDWLKIFPRTRVEVDKEHPDSYTIDGNKDDTEASGFRSEERFSLDSGN